MSNNQNLREFVQIEALRRDVSKAEREALILAVEGHDIPSIAQQLGIKPEAVRQRLSQVYQKFEIQGRGPVKLNKLQQMLRTRYQEAQAGAEGKPITLPPTPQRPAPRYDLDGAPDVSFGFYGRADQLETLKDWVIEDRCRLVSIAGLAEIGKTFLASQLAEEIKTDFDRAIWQSIYHAPSAGELVDRLLTFFVGRQEFPDNINDKISRLMDYLREHRCLVVLDDLEQVLRRGDRFGSYREGYEDYSLLLRRIGEEPHKSCFVLVGWESPIDVRRLQGQTQPARSLQLSGLQEEEAREVLTAEGLSGEDEWNWLIDTYRGHPLKIKLICQTIKELFGGDVAQFKDLNTVLIDDIPLEEHFDRLSELERQILQAIASEDKGLSFKQLLEATIVPSGSPSELIEALESLKQRSLLEQNVQSDKGRSKTILFTVQPIVKKYLNKQAALNAEATLA